MGNTYYIARHGQTEWNILGKTQGHGNSPLTEKGLAQANREWRIGLHIQHIICPIDVKPIYNSFLFLKDISR